MAKYHAEQFLQEASGLTPISQTATKALELLRDPNTNATDLAKILSTDQVLSAQVLRWSNAAYYGMKKQIVTVQQAIVVLGMDVIRQTIMVSSVSDHLNQSLPGYGLQRGELWHHALGTAIGAQLISKQHHLQLDDEAYFGGLLCDHGKLIFEKHLREIPLNVPDWEQKSFLDVERDCFGMDHAKLGAELAHHWQLPENLETAIAFHHEPHCASEHQMLAATIHVADMTMKILGIGLGIDGLRYPIDQEALKLLTMTWDDMVVFSGQVDAELRLAKETLYID